MGAAREFVFDARLPRVVFGAGTLRELPNEIERLASRARSCSRLRDSARSPSARRRCSALERAAIRALLQDAYDGMRPD